VIGLHSAGAVGTDKVMCVPITYECLQTAKKKISMLRKVYPVELPIDDVMNCVEEEDAPVEWQALGMEVLGVAKGVNGYYADRVVPKSDFVRSEFFDSKVWPDGHLPSAKSEAVLLKRSQKYGFDEIVRPIPYEIREVVMSELKALVRKFAHVEGERRSLLTAEEVLNGKEDSMLQPIKLDTSPGVWKQVTTKKYEIVKTIVLEDGSNWYELSENIDKIRNPLTGKTFRECLEEKREKGLKGERTLSWWTSTLKDELRPKAKVKIGKTRVFEVPDFEYVYVFREFCGDFCDWLRRNSGFVFCHGIGLDKPSVWNVLYKVFNAKGYGMPARGFDGDGKEFDSRIHPEMYECVAELMEEYYLGAPESHIKMRRVLIAELCESVHIIGKYVVVSEKGNKSGQPATDLVNSLCNMIYYMVSYQILYRREFGVPPAPFKFWEDICLMTYGDDSIGTADLKTLMWFNRETFFPIFGMFGQRLTMADKSAVVRPTSLLVEMDYLKSSFRNDGPITWSPMVVDVIYRLLSWDRKSTRESVSILRDKCNVACEFMSHHGEMAYEVFVAELTEKLKTHSLLSLIEYVPPTYNQLKSELWMKQQLCDLLERNSFLPSGVFK
jgi:hypothetical protein